MRFVAMNEKQYDDIERFVEWLMRNGQNERAARMMNLSLSYRFSKEVEETPDNVIEFPVGA